MKINIDIETRGEHLPESDLVFLENLAKSLRLAKQGELEPKKTEKAEPKKTEKVEEPANSGIDITEVRAALAEKVQEHRDEIKKELTRLGTGNVTNLEEKHYVEFIDFLDKL